MMNPFFLFLLLMCFVLISKYKIKRKISFYFVPKMKKKKDGIIINTGRGWMDQRDIYFCIYCKDQIHFSLYIYFFFAMFLFTFSEPTDHAHIQNIFIYIYKKHTHIHTIWYKQQLSLIFIHSLSFFFCYFIILLISLFMNFFKYLKFL